MSKVWFITGAGSGLGAETAKPAWRAGNRVDVVVNPPT
jgi:NAD(P)-dependent dehydrogenase (short-subunit alcohol dehydrogenase family)